MTVGDYHIHEQCCGCFACANDCPVHAIEMNQDAEGFYFPMVRGQLSTQCGRCEKLCPAITKPEKNSSLLKTYSFQAEDSIREKSSSGGFFYHLARNLLDQGGIVYGARFNAQSKEVEHASTDDVPLEELLRSKYVQSRIGNTFTSVRRELKAGRRVLFVGTPCQVHGLKAFLKKDDENLITLDFVCHGVPSPGYFRDWLFSLEKEGRSSIENVTFREKDNGWRKQIIKIYFTNGTQKQMQSSEYFYYRYFLRGVTLRKSCYTCAFADNHDSDLTMKDYWEISGDDDRGVSAIVANTAKGERAALTCTGQRIEPIAYAKIKRAFVRHEKDSAYKYCRHLRAYYMSRYAKYGFEKTVKRYNRMIDFRLLMIGQLMSMGGRIKKTIRKTPGRR